MAAKKLLVVTLGIAATTFACSDDTSTVGNAMPCCTGPEYDTGAFDAHWDATPADTAADVVDAAPEGDAGAMDVDASSDADVIDPSDAD
jgi:hypothetical protein